MRSPRDVAIAVDFADTSAHDFRLEYVADKRCVELKSLKLYLQDFRNKGIFYEDVVNVILDDLVAAMKPRRLTVEGDFHVRGGISSVVTATYEAPARGRGRRK